MNRARVVGAIAALVAVAAGVGCGDDGDDPPEEPAGPPAEVEVAPDVAGRMRWQAPRRAPLTAVRGDEMLVVGGHDEGAPALDGSPTLTVAGSAFLVDLTTGEYVEFPAPRGDIALDVRGVAVDNRGFVVVGARCRNGDSFPAGPLACAPGTGVSFVLDEGLLEWVEVPLPDAVSENRGEVPWRFDAVATGTAPGGEAFVAAYSGPIAGPPAPLTVLALTDAGWAPRASLADAAIGEVCATGDAFYALSSGAAGPSLPLPPATATPGAGIPQPAPPAPAPPPAEGEAPPPTGEGEAPPPEGEAAAARALPDELVAHAQEQAPGTTAPAAPAPGQTAPPTSAPPPPVDALPPAQTLYEVARQGDGTAATVALPGGVAPASMALACDGDGTYVTSGAPGGQAYLQVRRGDSWAPVTDGWPTSPATVTGMASAPGGIAVVTQGGGEGGGVHLVGVGDEAASSSDAAAAPGELLADPESGGLVAVGPLPGPPGTPPVDGPLRATRLGF